MTVESIRVTFDGGRLVADRREPPAGVTRLGTVLLLHGGGQTRHSWAASAAGLTRQGWTTIALDARGHGESGWDDNGDYGLDALVADLRLVVDSLDELPVLVGASMGGMTSLIGQGESGDLARALVLVDIVPKVKEAGVERILRFMSESVDGFETLDDVAAAIQSYNPRPTARRSERGLRKNVRQGTDGRWYWHWDPAFLKVGDEPTRGERYHRLVDAARRLDVPTLVVRGGNSDVVGDDGVRELLDLVPQAEYVDVDGAGHMVVGDDNSAFVDGMIGFLNSLPRS